LIAHYLRTLDCCSVNQPEEEGRESVRLMRLYYYPNLPGKEAQTENNPREG